MIIKNTYHDSSRKEMLDYITNTPNTILEIGCREGNFIKEVKGKFNIKDSWGIDPDEEVEELAKINIDNLIIDFFTKDSKLPEKYFDLIACNDVLEHMYDPWDSLIKIKDLLSKDGILIVSLPNIRHKSVFFDLFFNDNFEYKSAGILDITHIRFFTKTTALKMFNELGFDVLKCEPVVLKKGNGIRN